MPKWAYYNEIDPFAAAWLRELIKAGHIAPGEVDTRSIEDVLSTDLAGFVQCHFFAGIGVWSYALRRAGWPDDRPVWTGSCPCQPFSTAGKGEGFADERHLWPAFFHLISQCRPVEIFGEQVASKDGLAWLNSLQADLEGADYTVGAVDTCAAGFGAPHIRQRLYWVADANSSASKRNTRTVFGSQKEGCRERLEDGDFAIGYCGCGPIGGLADTRCHNVQRQIKAAQNWQSEGRRSANKSGRYHSPVRLDNPISTGLEGYSGDDCGTERRTLKAGPASTAGEPYGLEYRGRPGPVNGHWRDTDWLFCRDGKWRPVEPGTFPLAHGVANRVGRLRGYGNAINAIQAEEFIRAYMAVQGQGENQKPGAEVING